jgi:hypothetical protein
MWFTPAAYDDKQLNKVGQQQEIAKLCRDESQKINPNYTRRISETYFVSPQPWRSLFVD